MTQDGLSDESLVAGCAVEDPNALAMLFDRFADDVSRFVHRLRYVADADVEDLVQETFLQAFRAAGRFAGHSGVRTWLFAIAANLARAHARSASRRRGFLEVFSTTPLAPPRSPEAATRDRAILTAVHDAVERLSHDLRVAFFMCDVEGVPGVEVARALGIPQGTLYRRLHDARSLLREALEGVEP